jgi:hypothetical protein
MSPVVGDRGANVDVGSHEGSGGKVRDRRQRVSQACRGSRRLLR